MPTWTLGDVRNMHNQTMAEMIAAQQKNAGAAISPTVTKDRGLWMDRVTNMLTPISNIVANLTNKQPGQPWLDLGNYVKVPDVHLGPDEQTKRTLSIAGGIALLFAVWYFFIRRKNKTY